MITGITKNFIGVGGQNASWNAWGLCVFLQYSVLDMI